MATKTPQNRNKNKSSKSRASQAKRSSGLSAWFGRVGRRNALITIVFVLVFAGAGGWYVAESHASPWYCAQHIYYEGETSGYCVKNIQIQLADNLWMNDQNLATDGIFGPATKAAVIKYGYNMLKYNNNGVVGNGMWRSLCNQGYYSEGELYYITYGGPSNDGCGSVKPINYGSSYVGMVTTIPTSSRKYAINTQNKYSYPKIS
jgi:hypothetical protein